MGDEGLESFAFDSVKQVVLLPSGEMLRRHDR